MKKGIFGIFLFISIFFCNNVYALIDYSGAPAQTYIAYGSEIATLLRDSDTTCSDFLKSIDYDIMGTSGLTYEDNYIISLTGDNYVPGESFGFVFYDLYSDIYLKNMPSYDYIYLQVSKATSPKRYSMSCKTGEISLIETLTGTGNEIVIMDKQDIGYRYYTRFFQSSVGLVNPPKDANGVYELLGDYQFVGIYTKDGKEKMSSSDFIGKDTLDNTLLFGNGIPLQPFRNYLAEAVYQDVPYTSDYTTLYVSGSIAGVLDVFTLINEDYKNLDANLYIRPVTNNLEDVIQNWAEETFTPTFNLCFFADYSNISECTNHSIYYDPSFTFYDYNFVFDPRNILKSSKSGFSLKVKNSSLGNKMFAIRYNKNVWSTQFLSHESISSGANLKVDTIDGTYSITNDELVSTNDKIIVNNNPAFSSSSSGDFSFLGLLQGGIDGIVSFIGNVTNGIGTLFGSINALVASGFDVVNSLPTEVSSVLYLTFICGIIAIILKIFL